MPELPEIETLRRSLQDLPKKFIERIKFSNLAPVETTTKAKICQQMLNSHVKSVLREGKYLLIQNQHQVSLVIHLGMSGKLQLFPPPQDEKLPKHTHLQIFFKNGDELRYVDARRFGTISLSTSETHEDNPFLQRLGPDYLSQKLSEEIYIKRCRRHQKISLKSLALNQGIAAGLGNIYACEALYEARLSPKRLVEKTKDIELKNLLHAARKVLKLGIQYGGVSMRDYLDGKGHRGIMQDFLKVYDREEKQSLDKKGVVKRFVQNARSSFWVPMIQK